MRNVAVRTLLFAGMALSVPVAHATVGVPENLRLVGLTANSFALRADPVEGASGYLFEVFRLTGTPRTESREDFADAPQLSSKGWTFGETNNVSFGKYEGTTYPDNKTSKGDECCLQILAKKSEAAVKAEILSPEFDAFVSEYSFVSKCTGTGSDRISVFGRAKDSSEWNQLNSSFDVSTTKNWTTNAVPADARIVQVKFVFTADAEACKNCGIDTLRVIYGGDEARTPVGLSDGGKTENPEITVKDLDVGRYAYRIVAMDEAGDCRDSPWSEEGVVDLTWAGISVSAPTDVVCVPSGAELMVSWTAVANADHYLVTVAPADDRWNPVVMEAKTTACTLSVPVPALGQYVVEVTAVSPGGVSRAKTTVEDCEMTLGKPAGLTAGAVAVDTITAKWDGVPFAEGYQAKLFRITGNAGSAVSDYAGIANGDWPEGWEHYDTGTYSGPVPKLQFRSSWIATCTCPGSVTSFTCKFKSHVESAEFADDVSQTFIRVDVSVGESGNDWAELTHFQVSTVMQTFTETIPADRNVRRLRFSVDYAGDNGNYKQVNIEFGKVTVSYGTCVRTEITSTGTKECEAVFRDLDPSGRYVVEVVPQPSGDDANAAVSPEIDLAAEHFRKTGAISMAGLKRRLYVEDFSSLAEDARDTDLGKIHLDHWQFFKGTGEAEKLLYAKTSKTTGGVYSFGDPDVTDSFCTGSLATKTIGAMLGLAFANDTDASVGAPTLTFDSIQRTFKTNPATYVLEWLVTDGATSIGTEGEWHAMTVPDTAPYTDETKGERVEYRETGISVTPELGGRIQPGQVLVFRWRHANLPSGPMMAIDNVRVEFPSEKGFNVLIR